MRPNDCGLSAVVTFSFVVSDLCTVLAAALANFRQLITDLAVAVHAAVFQPGRLYQSRLPTVLFRPAVEAAP